MNYIFYCNACGCYTCFPTFCACVLGRRGRSGRRGGVLREWVGMEVLNYCGRNCVEAVSELLGWGWGLGKVETRLEQERSV